MGKRVELKTEHLLLRPLRLEDVDDIFEYAKDLEWARYLLVPQPFTRRSAEEFVARRIVASWETDPFWAMVLDRKVVGGIELTINVQHERAELGYSLARKYWRRGLTTEAGIAVVEYGFRVRGLGKIFASADARNTRSHRVMEKLGMTREGVLRGHDKGRGERTDEVYYGVLREEWEGKQVIRSRGEA